MANFTSVVASIDALRDAIVTFLTGSAGFTLVGSSGNIRVVSAGGIHALINHTASTSLILQHGEGSSGSTLTGGSGFDKAAAFFGVSISNAQVWGFANNAGTATDRYAHFVVEFARDGRFIHFGFTQLEKYNDWAGGACVYGGMWGSGAGVANDPSNSGHRVLIDSNHQATLTTVSGNLATLLAAGLPNQRSGGKFLGVSYTTSTLANDTDGDPVDKAFGFSRHGPQPQAIGHVRGVPSSGAILLSPIEVMYRSPTVTSRLYPLGRMRDTRFCNIGNIPPREQITQGADTWQFFPWAQKLTDASQTTVMQSRNAGIAYLVT